MDAGDDSDEKVEGWEDDGEEDCASPRPNTCEDPSSGVDGDVGEGVDDVSSVRAFALDDAFVVAVVGETLCGFAELKYLPPPGLEEKNEYARRDVANGSGWRNRVSIEASYEKPVQRDMRGLKQML